MKPDMALRVAVILIAVIATLVSLNLASSVFAPIAFALFIIAVVWPIQAGLQARLPKLLALAIVVLFIVIVFVVFASLVAWGFGRVGRWLVSDAARFQLLYEQFAVWLDGHGIAIARLWADHFNVGWLLRVAQQITGHVNTTLTFWLIVLIYVMLGLLEVDDIGRKVRGLQNRDAARMIIDGGIDIAAKFRRYMLVRTAMSLMTGALVWVFAAWMGLGLAAEWGVIAFVLNYIPFIGPFFATLLPTAFAAAQFASWETPLLVFACLNVIQFIVGSYIEPRLCGTMLSISPFVVLFAVFFWTFLWGLVGAFIGVPIMIAVLSLCAQHPSSRWISDLFGGPEDETAGA